MIPTWNTPAGLIANANENQPFSFFLSFNISPVGTVKIISGKLPDGLTLDNSGSILGTIGSVSQTQQYEFTVRLENTDGISDRNFSIVVNNDIPYWITDSVILEFVPPDREYRNRQVIDYNLEVNDNHISNIKYELISGRLPDGVYLREDGKITGYIKDIGETYIFTVRAKASIDLERTFNLVVLNDSANRPPFWSTLSGWLGDIRQGIYYQFNLRGDDSDNNSVSFSLKSGSTLPSGLTLNSSGLLSGILAIDGTFKHNFSILISDGIRTIEREFFLRCNYEETDEDIWITNPVNPADPSLLGTLEIDEDSSLRISAFYTSRWVRYEIINGNLPNGLSLNITTGDIEGTVLSPIGTYNFEVRVYNESMVETFKIFKIEVINRIEFRNKKVSTILTGYSRRQLNEYFYNYVIPYEDIFRPGDKNYGIKVDNEMIIKKYVDFNTKSELYSVFENKFSSIARPIEFKFVPVVNSKSEVFSELIYLQFKDDNDTVNRDSIHGQNTTNLNLMRYWLERDLNSPINSFTNWHTGWYNTDLSNDIFISENHDLYTGKEVFFKNQDIPSPFLNSVIYYAIVIDRNSFRLSYSYDFAQQGNYIQFNINDTNRPGIYHTHHNGIPIVFLKRERGQAIAQRLNNSFTESFFKIELNLNFIVHGPTQTKNQEDLEMMFFSNGELF